MRLSSVAKPGLHLKTNCIVCGPATHTRRGHGGKRADIRNGMYFRSSWEANYARYLTWLMENRQIENWEYEIDTFEFTEIKKGSRFYTPDFLVYNCDGTTEYHEVKGYMDARSRTKMNRMKKD
jgi:hypothetical protein